MEYEGIKPFTYFFQNTKLFLKFIGAHYKKDEKKLEQIYMDTLELYEKYINTYMDRNTRLKKLEEIIQELLEILSMREQNEELQMKNDHLFRGLKIKEKIVGTRYIELWVKGSEMWIYVYENNKNQEMMVPYIKDFFNLEQIYYALKKKAKQKYEH